MTRVATDLPKQSVSRTRVLLHKIKSFSDAFHPDRRVRELARLRKVPRYRPTHSDIFGKRIQIVDADTFVGCYHEIFEKAIYNFTSRTLSPRIIDCGANIGMSVIYFKTLYPQGIVHAFEPDPAIFASLEHNATALGLSDVHLHQKAVWTHDQGVKFHVEGGLSGRIPQPDDQDRIIQVESVRLRDYLAEPIDFLKIDIEGAETEVLRDCKTHLGNVDHLFVEYHSHYSREQTLQEVLTIFHDAGFRYHVTGAYTHTQPFLDHGRMLGMDLQLNIFGYRDR